jgi:hypothetical protein
MVIIFKDIIFFLKSFIIRSEKEKKWLIKRKIIQLVAEYPLTNGGDTWILKIKMDAMWNQVNKPRNLTKIAEIHYPSSIRVIEQQKLRFELLQRVRGKERRGRVKWETVKDREEGWNILMTYVMRLRVM